MAIPVRDYPDYMIYEDGRIWSNKSNKFLKPAYTKLGYASVELFNDNGSRRLLIHRLVAQAFIPNPNHYPQVNHIDENPKNNNVENLEWCTAKYNMNYGKGAKTRHSKIDYSTKDRKVLARKNGKLASKPLLMFTKSGEFVREFASAVDASIKTGIYKTNISRSAKSDHLCAGGYKFEFKNERSDDLLVSQY